jgi:1,2-dihydroxy-3-keto-5-methylthiopentene dioxygenase
MTKLVVLPSPDPGGPLLTSTDGSEITAHLAAHGVLFERWALQDGPDPLVAYQEPIATLGDAGYTTVDVAQLHPAADDPEWATKAAAARSKFLDEHTHADDEVRFFVSGRGAFYLRFDPEVDVVVCEAGDMISVPAGTRHWFDMGTAPDFAAVRFFRIADGWVGEFTGDPIAKRFPTFDELVAAAHA